MKVLVIVPWYEPAWSAGGTSTAVSSLNRELTKLGVEITVLTTNDAGNGKLLDVNTEKLHYHGGVKVFYHPCNFFIKNKKAFYSSELIKRLINEVPNYDLIHIHSTRHIFSLIASIYAKKHEKKYIITPHASLMKWWMEMIGNSFFKKIYMSLIESYTIKNTTSLHFLSKEEKLQSQDYSYGAGDFIVGNGIKIQDFNIDHEIRLEWRKKNKVENKNVLLFLGRIHPQKNLQIVIETMMDLENTVLFLVGPTGDKNYFNLLASLISKYKLKNKVFFIPPITKSEVKYWYWMSDFFVSPSLVEGISMSMIESLSASLPIITSKNVANYQEIIEDNSGFIIENKHDLKILLQKLESKSIDVEKYRSNARRSAENRYDISVVASEMKDNYERILSE